jgi:capsular polysaccharide transport system permease protein
MDADNNPVVKESSALARARDLSQALADAARRARLSSRSRRKFVGGGFQARKGAAFMRAAAFISFFAMVALPASATAIYYTFIASDQYLSEAKFTVSGGEPARLDGIGAFTGIPAISVIQDTQIVTNYIESRAAVEKLETTINLRKLYSGDGADWFARFNPNKPIEKLVKYWQHMVDISIKMPSGIVEFKVRAFTREDSARIAQAVLDLSEALINDLNKRMNRDAISNAELELDRAASRLTKARLALEKARNEGGLLDANKAGDALNGLITEARGTLLQLQQEYMSQRAVVLENAPQMRALKSRIDVTVAQISDLESKVTTTNGSAVGESSIATSISKFGELDLERQIAERLYAGAAASLEVARITAENKAMYINAFVRPVTPEESQYPRRWLFTSLFALGCLALWGLCCGLVVVVRNHMA